ncbi:hypothetical protein VTJ04DRAFT_4944 [Mycothermus thermophilus]|uniref:uncharacterized protein n=1 Tax=Humicola insolens TaxID=85995 RepID=UPI0037444B5C
MYNCRLRVVECCLWVHNSVVCVFIKPKSNRWESAYNPPGPTHTYCTVYALISSSSSPPVSSSHHFENLCRPRNLCHLSGCRRMIAACLLTLVWSRSKVGFIPPLSPRVGRLPTHDPSSGRTSTNSNEPKLR